MKKLFLLLLVAWACWSLYIDSQSESYGPGILALQPPTQKKLDPPRHILFGDFTITELATFDLKAKVLSKKNYWFDQESALSPTDLALGWGLMSDEQVLEDIKITQSGRFYRWQVREFPIDAEQIQHQSANMHLVPFNDEVADRIRKVREGQIIHLTGSLIRADHKEKGWYWKSSLTRKDTGAGACEIILVKHLEQVKIERPE